MCGSTPITSTIGTNGRSSSRSFFRTSSTGPLLPRMWTVRDTTEPTKNRTLPGRPKLLLEPVSRSEDPPNHGKAEQEKAHSCGQADRDRHVGLSEEGPAEAVDEIDDRVEQSDAAPGLSQH